MVGAIVTVTPSPALDRTLFVDRLAFGGIARIRQIREDPGGKDINVSRVLRQFGRTTMTLGFIGGTTGRRLEKELAHLGIETDFVVVEGETRVNLTITDGERELKVNEPGPPIAAAAVEALVEKVRRHARGSPAVVLAGSLPPEVSEGLYAELVELIRQEGSRPVLDSEGKPLAMAVGVRPYLIKPNLAEAEGLLGTPLTTEEAICRAARHLRDQGIDVVVISLGERGGVMACQDRVWRAEIPQAKAVSTVGAGDSMLACLLILLLDGLDPASALRRATAAGLASAALPGSMLCAPPDVDQMVSLVRVREL